MNDRAHIAVRSCVGCGERDSQALMVRLARGASGILRIDVKRSMPGRGAYLHRADPCLSRFAKRRGVIRSLRVAVDAPVRAGIVAELRGQRESE